MLNILPFLVISSGCVFGATYLNKKYEEMLPFTIFSIIFLLFIFYIFNVLDIGFVCIIILSICFYVLSLKRILCSKKSKNTISNIFTPGFLCFCIILIVLNVLLKNNYVRLWDELRLWGAYPKLLFYDGSLKVGVDTMLYPTMQSYLPGMPLFQYFWSKCTGQFIEYHLFISYVVVGVSVFMPLLKHVDWKHAWKIIPVMITILSVPLIFYNSGFDEGYYYSNLFIDPMIGIIFGYTIYLSLFNNFNNMFNLCLFILSLCTLVLLKDSGVALAFVSVISSCFAKLFIYKIKKNEIKPFILKILLILSLVFLISFGWKTCINRFGVNNDFTSGNSFSFILQFITHTSEKQKEGLNIFLDFLKHQPLIINKYKIVPKLSIITEFLTYRGLILNFIAITIMIAFMLKNEERKKFVFGSSFVLLGNILFTIGLLFLCILTGNYLFSFPRYINTVMLACAVFLAMFLIQKMLLKDTSKWLKLFVIILVVFSAIIFPIRRPGKYDTDSVYQQTSILSQKIKKIIKNDRRTNVFFLGNSDYMSNTLFHHHLYIKLIDQNIFIKNFSTETFVNCTYEEWKTYLLQNSFEYVYVYNFDDNKFISDFSDDLGFKIENNMILKVNSNNGKLELIERNAIE